MAGALRGDGPGTGRLRLLAALAALLVAGGASAERPVEPETGGGDAWTFDKLISAEVAGNVCDEVAFTSPAGAAVVRPRRGRVLARVPLAAGENLVEAQCLSAGAPRGAPAAQRWQVRLADTPKAWIRAVPADGGLALDAGASRPASARVEPLVTWHWRARPGNPAPLAGLPAAGERIELATPGADGEYYVTLTVTDAAGRSDESTAMFRVAGGRFDPVDLAREHPAWVDKAVVYGVAPFFFDPPGFDGVTARLDELADLGVNTLWLSPVTATAEGDFGYAVTDYFRLRADFGSKADFRELVDRAHARGMRVIMDFVPNHVASTHPYFADAEKNGRHSPYYTFFERDAAGRATHYFDWNHLINLDYDNPEVQTWIIEAFAYWVREYGIDGFRADAVWGPRRRAPEFWARWRRELKRIRPDLLLLAEASARDPYYFESGFDVAYDWTEALGQWAWRDAFEDPARTARRLRAAIAASQAQEEPDALVFRFLDNNDTGDRFVTRYGPERTRLAAAMLLTLPGMPQIYTGQEIGAAFQPYDEGPPIAWRDVHKLRPWYRRLIALRAEHDALRSYGLQFLDIGPPDRLLAYLRPGTGAGQSLLVLLNWSAGPLEVELPEAALEAIGGRAKLVDLIRGQQLSPGAPVSLAGYGVRVLAGE